MEASYQTPVDLFNEEQTVPELIRLFLRPAFIAYFSVEIFVDILIIMVIKYVEYNISQLKEERSRSFSNLSIRNEAQSSIPSLIIESTSGDIFYTPIDHPDLNIIESPEAAEVATEETPLVAKPLSGRDFGANRHSASSPLLRSSTTLRAIKKGRMSTLVGIMYAALGGMVASITLILTKSGVEILFKSLVDTGNQAHRAFALVLLIILVISAVVQVKLSHKVYSLNAALKYELPVVVLPVFFSLFTCLSLTNTMVYLDAFEIGHPIYFLYLTFGVVLLISGVFTLSRSK